MAETHLAGRLAAGVTPGGAEHDNWGGEPVPAHIRTWHDMWAGEYVARLAAGEPGAAFSYLHGLRYGAQSAYVDPWRLLERVARQALSARETAAGQATAAAPATVTDTPGGTDGVAG